MMLISQKLLIGNNYKGVILYEATEQQYTVIFTP